MDLTKLNIKWSVDSRGKLTFFLLDRLLQTVHIFQIFISKILRPRIILGLILFLALGVRVLFLLDFYHVKLHTNPLIEAKDEREYYLMAENFYLTGRLNDSPDTVALRTPGAPFLFGLIFKVFGSKARPVFFSLILIDCLTLLIIFFLARDVFRSEWLALLPSFFYAVSSLPTAYCLLFMSEIPGTFLLTLIVCLFLKYRNSFSWQRYGLWGFLLGLATLTRPVFLYFPAVIIVAALVIWRKSLSKIPVKNIWLCLIVMIISYGLTLAPWGCRNWKKFGHFALTDQMGVNLFRENVPLLLARVKKTTENQGRKILRADVRALAKNDPAIFREINSDNPFQREKVYNLVSWRYIRAYPLAYLLCDLRGAVNIFTDWDDRREIKIIKFLLPTTPFLNPNTFLDIFIFNLFWSDLFFIIGLTGLFINQRTRFLAFFFTLVTLFHALLAGPVGRLRLKIPFIPFMLVVTSYGIIMVVIFLKTLLGNKKQLR